MKFIDSGKPENNNGNKNQQIMINNRMNNQNNQKNNLSYLGNKLNQS